MSWKKKCLAVITAGIIAFEGTPMPILAEERQATNTGTAVEQVSVSAQAQTIYDAVKAELKSVTFDDMREVMGFTSNAYYISQSVIRTELIREGNLNPTTEQIRARAMQRYLQMIDLKAAYEEVIRTLDVEGPKVMQGLYQLQYIGRWGITTDTIVSDIKANKIGIIFGLTYLQKYYGFQVGNTTAKELILNHQELFSEHILQKDSLNVLEELAINGNTTTEYKKCMGYETANVFQNKIAPYLGNIDFMTFLSRLAEIDGSSSVEEFLHKTSNAIIGDSYVGFIEKAQRDTDLQTYILPLMNLSDSSVYVITTNNTTMFGLTGTYRQKNDGITIEDRVKQVEKSQNSYINRMEKFSSASENMNLEQSIIVVDTMTVNKPATGSASQYWGKQYGEDADTGIREFMNPLNQYATYMAVGAWADRSSNFIRYYMDEGLSGEGIATFTHEVTHIYDKSVWLNNQNYRNGASVEFYARGLFESIDNTQTATNYTAPVFNLNFCYELQRGEGSVQNASPSRFETKEDVQEYMHGVMDVIYTLDAIEAEEILKLSDAQKMKMFNKVSIGTDTNGVTNVFENITEAEAQRLQTIDDLADANIVSGRLVPANSYTVQTVNETSTYDYMQTPLFEGVYGGLQNDSGYTGRFLFKRYAYELLAEYGWENGFIDWLSGKYANDTQALQTILDERYHGSMNEFKKAMINERIQKMNQLKPITGYADAEELHHAMAQAIEQDLASMSIDSSYYKNRGTYSSKAVQKLKTKIFNEYLIQTNEFRDSIYQPESQVHHSHSDQNMDGVCDSCHTESADTKASLYAYNVSLDGDIGVNIYMELGSEIANDPNTYLRFTMENGNEMKSYISETKTKEITDPGTGQNKKYYVFDCHIYATQMTEVIHMQVVSGGRVSQEHTFSVREYAKRILNDTANQYSGEAKQLVKAMLNYGGASQQFFDYKTSDLANDFLSEEEKQADKQRIMSQMNQLAKPEVMTRTVSGIQYYGTSTVLCSNTKIRHYFTLDEGSTMDSYRFQLGSKTLTPVSVGDKYYVEIADIPANRLGTTYELVIRNEKNESATISYSVYQYIQTVLNGTYDEKLKHTARMMYLYGEQANIYAGQ